MANQFSQYVPCENNDFEVPHVGNSSQKAIQNDHEVSQTNKRIFMHFEPQKMENFGSCFAFVHPLFGREEFKLLFQGAILHKISLHNKLPCFQVAI